VSSATARKPGSSFIVANTFTLHAGRAGQLNR
jgi:hypothetical protein